MDNSVRWSAPPALVLVGGLGAVGSVLWCLLTPDPAGRVLIGCTALALAAATLYGVRARPRLAAGPDGIVVGGMRGPRRFPWSAVRRLEVVRTRRLGREVPTLEIETLDGAAEGADDRLHVFSRIELGADPRDVLEVLADQRP